MGVDIISMSWSFNTEKRHGHEIDDFEKAIRAAAGKGILLFAAINDSERANLANYLPIRMTEVIRIGSATSHGRQTEFTQPMSAEFLFPGNKVVLPAPGSTTGAKVEVSGSSTATAFAAGLAGLIIYIMRVHESAKDSGVERQECAQRLEETKKKVGMARIFRALGGHDTTKIGGVDLDVGTVALRDHFPQNPIERSKEIGDDALLADFLHRIMPIKG